MDDSQLSDDLSNCSIEELLNLSFSLESLNSFEETYQFIDTMTSSIVSENSELPVNKETLHEGQTAEASIETVEVDNKQSSQYIDLEKNHSPEQPPQSDHVEIAILKDPKQRQYNVVHLQKENTTVDSSSRLNNQLTMRTSCKICLTTNQVTVLEREFKISHYPDRFTRKKLALKLNLTQMEVREWFANRRMKMKRLEPYKQSIRSKRHPFNKSQIAMLEREFQINRRPDCLTRQKLSLMSNLKDSQVYNWFVYRRGKMRKLNEHRQSLQNKSITSSELDQSFKQQDLAKESNINNSQLVAIEHAFKKYPSARSDTVYLSAPTINSTNQQIQVPQIGTSSQLAAIEQTFKKYQFPRYDTICKSIPILNSTNQQVQVPQIETFSFSSLNESNEDLEKKTTGNLGQLVQSQIESSNLPKAIGSFKRKRNRTNLCHSQLMALEREYNKSQYPDYDTVHQLAATINLTENQIRVWFKNQRAKQKMSEKYNLPTILPQTMICDFSLSSGPPMRKPEMVGKYSQPVQPQTTTCDFPLSGEFSKQKQKRTSTDGKSRFIALEREFKKCQHPNLVRICQLASKFNFTNSQVRRWFAMRRLKQRKSKKQRQVMQPQSGTSNLSPLTASQMPKYWNNRTNLNGSQLAMLENEFRKCKYPNYGYLASIFNVSSDEIRDWFKIRRTNQRKLENYGQIVQDPRETFGFSPSTEFSKQNCWTQGSNLNESQLAMLENEFRNSQYPNYGHLALIFNVSYEEVRDWFIVRRAKQRILEIHGQRVHDQRETLSFSPRAGFSKQTSRRRFIFNENQVAILENHFRQNQYADYDTVCSLATMLDVPREKVRTWFINRRSKEKNLKRLGQLASSQTETTNPPPNNLNFVQAQPYDKQIQQFGYNHQPPIFRGGHANNPLPNHIQQMSAFPQNWQFEGYSSSISSALDQQTYGMGSLPLIQEENQFYINPTPASAQYVFSSAYVAPTNSESILLG